MITVHKSTGNITLVPSSMTWDLEDISSSDTGRSQSGLMYQKIVARKRKLSLSWKAVTKEEAQVILSAVVDESPYLSVTYPDALSGTNERRTFYVSAKTAPVYTWQVNKKIYSSISFDLIER